jgi:hypothetical protein
MVWMSVRKGFAAMAVSLWRWARRRDVLHPHVTDAKQR